MSKLRITGGFPLQGTVNISGAKNAAVAMLPAALLTEAPVTIENLPNIHDVHVLVEILKYLNVGVNWESPSKLRIDGSTLQERRVPYELVKKLRASYYLMGTLLGRFGRVEIPVPGGCDLGPRPIDQHLKGMAALGADIEVRHGIIKMKAGKLRGANIYLDVISVGATIKSCWRPPGHAESLIEMRRAGDSRCRQFSECHGPDPRCRHRCNPHTGVKELGPASHLLFRTG